jgi:hypothetical protein
MGKLPPVPNCLEITLQQSDGGDSNIENKFHLGYTLTVTTPDLTTLLSTIASAWGTHLAPIYNGGFSLIQIVGNDLASDFGAKVALAATGGGTATGTGMLASGTAVVVQKKEAQKYKGGHPRTYLAGQLRENLQDSNTWKALWQTTVATAWQQFIHEIVTTAVPAAMGVLTEVVAHRHGDAPGGPVLANGWKRQRSAVLTNPYTNPISSYTVNPQVASQRRRNQQP